MCRLISDLCWEMLRNANRLKNYVTVKSVLHRIACFIKASVCSISTRITIQDELISVRQVCVNVFCSWKENRVSCRTKRLPLQEMLEEIKRILEFEMLLQPTADYMQWQNEAGQISEKEKRKAHVIEQMKKLREESVDMLEKQKLDIVRRQEEKKESIDSVKKAIWQNEQDIEKFNNMIITTETEWLEREKMLAEENKRRSEERTQMLESQFQTIS